MHFCLNKIHLGIPAERKTRKQGGQGKLRRKKAEGTGDRALPTLPGGGLCRQLSLEYLPRECWVMQPPGARGEEGSRSRPSVTREGSTLARGLEKWGKGEKTLSVCILKSARTENQASQVTKSPLPTSPRTQFLLLCFLLIHCSGVIASLF